MARLPIKDSDAFCQWLLEEFSYNNETVMLAPATGFYSTPGLGKNEVRLAYVLNVDAINKAPVEAEKPAKPVRIRRATVAACPVQPKP